MDADWKEEDHPRREDGKFGSGGGKNDEEKPSKPDDEIIEKGSSSEKKTEEKELTEEAKRSKLKSSSKGENIFTRGFSKRNLDRHWEGGTSDHSEQYPDLDKEGYSQRALDLVQMAVGGNIEGYANENGQVVRYDKESNDFVKGRPDEGIATMFKPTDGIEYYYRWKKREAMEDDKDE